MELSDYFSYSRKCVIDFVRWSNMRNPPSPLLVVPLAVSHTFRTIWLMHPLTSTFGTKWMRSIGCMSTIWTTYASSSSSTTAITEHSSLLMTLVKDMISASTAITLPIWGISTRSKRWMISLIRRWRLKGYTWRGWWWRGLLTFVPDAKEGPGIRRWNTTWIKRKLLTRT